MSDSESNASSEVAFEPHIYDGTPNLIKFDKWVHSIEIWKKYSRLNDEYAVMLLLNYVSGQAEGFYVHYVLPNPAKWELSALLDALFEFCFPSNYKFKMKKKLLNSKQGSRPLRVWASKISGMAERLDILDSWEVKGVLWDGAVSYIRSGWIRAGYTFESTPLEKLIEKATIYEDVYEELNAAQASGLVGENNRDHEDYQYYVTHKFVLKRRGKNKTWKGLMY